MNRVATVSAIIAAASVVIAGCSSDDSQSADTAPRSNDTSSMSSSLSPSSKSSSSSESSSTQSKQNQTEKSEGTSSPEQSTGSSTQERSASSESVEPQSSVITTVSDADFTPADGPNTRLFQLADGSTKCFLNDLGGDVFLACQANLNNPPMVPDGTGKKVPANAVSWNPSGVTYESLMFPQAGGMKTLQPNQQISAFGYTCTSHGAANIECSGAAGTATIDSGNVTGARVPADDSGNSSGAGSPGAAPNQGAGGLIPQLPGLTN